MEKLAPNVIENMANNYCYLFNCHDLYRQMKAVIEEENGKKLPVYRVLVAHFGRVISSQKSSFVGELARGSHRTLLEEINKHCFFNVRSRKKYPGSEQTFVTFLVLG